MKNKNHKKVIPDNSIVLNSTKELEDLFDKTILDSDNLNESEEQHYFEELSGRICQIKAEVKSCHEKLAQLTEQTKEFKAADSVITELSSRCKQLSEQFYETEVLYPVLLCLIGIGDRCRQQINTLQELASKHAGSYNGAAIRAINYLIDARKADLAELENTLANHGAEPYETDCQIFDAKAQKCIHKTLCGNKEQHGLVSQRLLPGYKRYGKILRKECVSVFSTINETPEKGGKSC